MYELGQSLNNTCEEELRLHTSHQLQAHFNLNSTRATILNLQRLIAPQNQVSLTVVDRVR